MAEHIVPRSTYYLIYVILVFFTGLTTTVAFFDLGVMNPIVAMTIAIVKATIVVLFFMHLYYSSRLTWIVWGGALFWLGIMLVLTSSDYLTRSWGRL